MTAEKTKMPSAANDPKAVAQKLFSLMHALEELMEKETELLARREIVALDPLREEKVRLLRDFLAQVELLKAKPDLLRAAPLSLRDKLRTVDETLHAVATRNAAALKKAVDATQRVIQTVVEAARGEIKKSDNYADPRKERMALGKHSPTCAPVAVARTI